MTTRMKYITVVAVVGATTSASTLAQELAVEEVIVTAQKREQRLVDVPVAIAAIGGEELEQKGLTNIQDIAFTVPGMALREDGPGSYQIFMRGLSNQYGADALVGVYLDEAPMTLSGADQLDVRPLDLERVEVLKGPQGTLYGQGSVAGAIRYITKSPDLSKLGGAIEAQESFISGGDSREVITGVLNAPIVTDKFGIRIAAQAQEGGGWQDQPQAGIKDGNNQDLRNVRLKALWKPTDALAVQGMVVVHRNESELGLGFENPDRTVTVAVDRSRRLVPKEFDYDLYNLDVKYDLGFGELLSSSTYIDHTHRYPFSYIAGPATNYGEGVPGAPLAVEGTDDRQQAIHQFSQELRLSSSGDGFFNYTFGGFYRSLGSHFTAVYDTIYDYIDPAIPTFNFGYFDYLEKEQNESFAVFGDVSFRVTDWFELGGGVRYFEDDQETFDGFSSEKDSFDSTDPRVYASFKLSDDINIYASAGSGFRSGGFNRGDLPNYQPETLWSYEVGSKGLLAGGVLAYEVAVFYSDYKDMLRRGLILNPDGTTIQNTTNIGKAEVKGAEIGLTWRPFDQLTLNATAAYMDSEIVEVKSADATNNAGDPIDYVPEFSYTLGANYEFDLSATLPAFFRVDYTYRDKVSYIDRSVFYDQFLPFYSDDISLLSARLGVTVGRANIELFGTNLTNQNQWIDPYHYWTNANRTRPRELGVKVGYSF
ncbi:TonB-dependent receptor [Steroidobacter sp. S1-65]|uniref:TonB-dependent receptor n=1 Tax=Steroidobacter gossypii TaxID=2805490 RepID=A0ABS1X1R1_9GAMM|nr:TonB-dependent receptor [Steroidobacter gossypii]MBM0107184.1 TonB-dependent receptor [Steroidobacter gossypii]